MIVRCWPRLAWARHVASAELGAQVVALRADEADPVPRLPLADLGDPAPIAAASSSVGRQLRLAPVPRAPARPP